MAPNHPATVAPYCPTPQASLELLQGLLFWLFKGGGTDRGSCKGHIDIDMDVEVDVGIHRYFGC